MTRAQGTAILPVRGRAGDARSAGEALLAASYLAADHAERIAELDITLVRARARRDRSEAIIVLKAAAAKPEAARDSINRFHRITQGTRHRYRGEVPTTNTASSRTGRMASSRSIGRKCERINSEGSHVSKRLERIRRARRSVGRIVKGAGACVFRG